MKNVVEQTISLLENVVDRRFGGNTSEAARYLELDVKSCILAKWLKGERSPTLAKIAPVYEKLGVTLNIPDEKLAEYVLIPKVAAKAGAGGSLETGDGTESLYSFRKDWLNKLNIHAAQAVLLEVVGDSMEPLMREGDTIMVDRGDTEIVDGKIYLVTLGDELKVKIVQKGISGLFLCSENPRYKDIPVTGPDLEQFKVHGRVRWVGKEL